MAETAYKRCSECSETRPTEDFYKDKRAKDGLYSCCKPCQLAKNKAWREANPEKNRAAIDRWHAAHPDASLESLRRWRRENPEKASEAALRHAERYPEKARARWAAKRAIARGDLKRPAVCEGCDGPGRDCIDGRASIQAHHPDYSKPLEVEWLCQNCHAARHTQ